MNKYITKWQEEKVYLYEIVTQIYHPTKLHVILFDTSKKEKKKMLHQDM